MKNSLEHAKQRKDTSEQPIGRHLTTTSLDEDVDELSEPSVFLCRRRRSNRRDRSDDLEGLGFGRGRLDDGNSGLDGDDHRGRDGLTGLGLHVGYSVAEESKRTELHL